jgi:hypothetical protein
VAAGSASTALVASGTTSAGAAGPQALRAIAMTTSKLRQNHNFFVLFTLFMLPSPFVEN